MSIEGSIHDNVVMGHSFIACVCVSPNDDWSLPDVCEFWSVCVCVRERER